MSPSFPFLQSQGQGGVHLGVDYLTFEGGEWVIPAASMFEHDHC